MAAVGHGWEVDVQPTSSCLRSHRSFTDQTLLDFSAGKSGDNLHNFQVAQACTLAFFAKYLRHDSNTALDSPIPIDPRAQVDRFPAR